MARDMTAIRSLVLLVTLAALAACPNPNTYTSARTLRAGDAQVLVAAEAYGGIDEDLDGNKQVEVLPTLPTVGVRYGLADSTEIALRAVNLMSLAADTKVQLRRGDLDIAIDPGVQWFNGSGHLDSGGDSEQITMHIFDLHIPLLFGINLSPDASFVVTSGATFRAAVSDSVDTQWFGLAGLGLNVRVTKRFAMQPQITVAWDPISGDGTAVGGLGFTFGGQPRFNELATPTEPAALARR